MDPLQCVLAKNIRKLRITSAMSQQQVATRLNVTYQAVSKWERCRAVPDVFVLVRLARIFGCSLDEFFSE